MPLQTSKDEQGCFIRWGDQGHKYYYKCGNIVARKNARKKAINQAIAIGEFAAEKISFDYDEVLTKQKMKDKAIQYMNEGILVYVISARHHSDIMYKTTDKLGIPRSRVFSTGSSSDKIKKILELGITTHYDNNPKIINELGGIGKLVKLTVQETFSEYIKFIKRDSYNDYPQQATENAKIALRWAEKNGWGSCGTDVGKIRANQLAKRENITEDTIARMASFERHRQNSQKELGDGCGRLMWLAWGGDAGIEWAQRKLEQIRKK